MPTYEYECQKCGHRFEEFQSMKDEPLKKCPVCKGKVKRLIGAGAGLLFKGSGFYITDYRSSGYSDKQKKDAGPAGGGEKSGGEKSGGEKSGGEKSGGDKGRGGGATPAKEPKAPKKSQE
jgi:putative FmdB family regulatory protein